VSVASFVLRLYVLDRVNSGAIGKQLLQTVDQGKSEEQYQCRLHIQGMRKMSKIRKMPNLLRIAGDSVLVIF
jgi:hypothetical protein